MHTQSAVGLVAQETLRTTSSFLHTGHLTIVDYLLCCFTDSCDGRSQIIDNEQCRLAGLNIILFAVKLFSNCNLSTKCVTVFLSKFPLFSMLSPKVLK